MDKKDIKKGQTVIKIIEFKPIKIVGNCDFSKYYIQRCLLSETDEDYFKTKDIIFGVYEDDCIYLNYFEYHHNKQESVILNVCDLKITDKNNISYDLGLINNNLDIIINIYKEFE